MLDHINHTETNSVSSKYSDDDVQCSPKRFSFNQDYSNINENSKTQNNNRIFNMELNSSTSNRATATNYIKLASYDSNKINKQNIIENSKRIIKPENRSINHLENDFNNNTKSISITKCKFDRGTVQPLLTYQNMTSKKMITDFIF